MSVETQRQEARRVAREVRSVHANRRREKEKRLEDLAVAVLVALDMRAECERQAGQALTLMMNEEGLTLHEAVEWCGSAVSFRTASRLRALAARSDQNGTNGEAPVEDPVAAPDDAEDDVRGDTADAGTSARPAPAVAGHSGATAQSVVDLGAAPGSGTGHGVGDR